MSTSFLRTDSMLVRADESAAQLVQMHYSSSEAMRSCGE